MDLVLGLDIGTTEVKALTWDAASRSHASASRKVRLITPQAGWVEQDARELWEAVVEVCSQVAAASRVEGSRIRAVSFSTQGGTTIPVDAHFEPVRHAFSWMDERATRETSRISALVGSEKLYRATGWPVSVPLPLSQVAWFREHQPDEYRRTARFLFVNDYTLYHLSGALAMDPSNAGITQLYNLERNDWDDDLLAVAGIRRDQLSPVLPSGQAVARLSRAAAGLTGLPEGIPIINGAHDQYCAALGAGVVRPGDVLLSCGTAWVLLFVLDRPEGGFEHGLAVSRHPGGESCGGILDLGGVGSTMEWLIDTLWDEKLSRGERFALLEQAVAASPRGANGLLFVPLSGGYALPDEVLARGPTGLSLLHARADLARAAMEGIALELDLLLAGTAGKIPIQRLIMIGGASRNPHWPQMIADITGLPVAVPQVTGAASLGAAVLAGKSLGWYAGEDAAGSAAGSSPGEFVPVDEAVAAYALLKYRYHQARKKIA